MPDQVPIGLAPHDEQRVRSRLTLEFGSRDEFEDPRFAYRRLFAELLGTFLLVLVAAGGGVLHAKGQISLSAAVVAPGLMVMAVVLFMGAVSGAHLNPVVSLAFAMRRDFPGIVCRGTSSRSSWARLGLPVSARRVRQRRASRGHAAGPWLCRLAGTAVRDRAHRRSGQRDPRNSLGRPNVGTIGALGVGGYIALAGLWSAPVSGTSMNPARSFGPALSAVIGRRTGSMWPVRWPVRSSRSGAR